MKLQGKSLPRRAVLLGLAAWVVAAVTAGTTAQAAFQFNPTGGGAPGALTITGFDPLPGSALAQGAAAAINNARSNGGGDVAANQFTLVYQAALGSLLPPGNTPGLNSTYQITFTGVVREFVQSVNGSTAVFGVSGNQAGSFLNMYQNNGVTYSDFNGTGFTNGTLILTATPVPTNTAGNFSNTGGSQALDQHASATGAQAFWNGTSTVGGFGGSVIDFKVNTADANYFITGLPANVLSATFSSTQNLPFTSVDPSRAFFNGATTNVGSINGLTGPDVLLQADANINVVPEPSSLCLTALGVGGLVGYALRKRSQVS